MATDTSEKGLESIIVSALQQRGWIAGQPQEYEREHAVDLAQLTAFLEATQPKLFEALDLHNASPARLKFLSRLQGEVTKRGVVDVLRRGIDHGPHHVDLFYGAPTPGNEKAAALNALNRFSVTRQLRYSRLETALALDVGLFINGLPVATMELKNSVTKQTVADAVEQYRRDRDPRELLFSLGRCVAHFAVDDAEPGTNIPPLHPRCRSIISGSLYAEHKPRKGTRIARDEHGKNIFVPAGMRYEEWKSVYIDKKQTVSQWLRKNVASQATNTAGAVTNAAGALNAVVQSGTINAKEAIKQQIAAIQLDTCSVQDVVNIGEAICAEHDVLGAIGKPDELRAIFANYREMGGALRTDQWAKGSSKVNKQMLAEAFAHYPKAWVDYFSATGRKLYTRKEKRGYFSEAGAVKDLGRKYVTSLPNYTTDYFTIAMNELRKSTPWHEIGHMVEHLNPNALRISKEFIAARTAGEALTPLQNILQGLGYRAGEMTRKDDFISPYIGKEYADASEVLSVGLESLFCDERQLKRATKKAGQTIYEYAKIESDEEYLKLIIGLILLA